MQRTLQRGLKVPEASVEPAVSGAVVPAPQPHHNNDGDMCAPSHNKGVMMLPLLLCVWQSVTKMWAHSKRPWASLEPATEPLPQGRDAVVVASWWHPAFWA